MGTILDTQASGPVSVARTTAESTVAAFCDLLCQELRDRAVRGWEVEAIRHYYKRLALMDGRPDPLGVRGYALRLKPALDHLRQAKRPVTLMDAGCGYGTEALLFSLLGADVTGVELVADRVELARSRLDFYQQQGAARLPLRFVHANAVRYLQDGGPFDMIWLMEAISHIHPLESFLPLAYDRLVPGGVLVVSDPNALNPLALYRAWRIRGTTHRLLRLKAVDPKVGEPVYEAVERVLPVTGLIGRLRRTGFVVQQVSMSGFMAASLVPSAWHNRPPVLAALAWSHRLVESIPGLRYLGTIYTLVAQKPETIDGDKRDG